MRTTTILGGCFIVALFFGYLPAHGYYGESVQAGWFMWFGRH